MSFNYNNCCSLLDTSYKLIIFISLVPNNGFLIIKKVCVWVSLNGNVGIYLYKLIDRISNLIPIVLLLCVVQQRLHGLTLSLYVQIVLPHSLYVTIRDVGQLFMLVVDAHAL